MDPGTRGELVLAEMGEDTPSTNHRARDFRYQHAEKSRLGDVETQGDIFHHWRIGLGSPVLPSARDVRSAPSPVFELRK
jgi:hypothetical protein